MPSNPRSAVRIFAMNASLTRWIESASLAGTATAAIDEPSAWTMTSGRCSASRYQRPAGPRTDRMNASSPAVTTQMIVRCVVWPSIDVVWSRISRTLASISSVAASNCGLVGTV